MILHPYIVRTGISERRLAGVLPSPPCANKSTDLGLRFRPLPFADINWSDLENYPDRTVFQSRAWLEFVVRTQRAEPLVLALQRGGETIGYFTCLLTRRCGFRIAGSPFNGWTTGYMGFNVRDEAVRDEALQGIGRFIFGFSRCAHIEVMDRQVDGKRAESLALDFKPFRTYEINLARSETELIRGVHESVGRYIRRAERNRNITIEECSDLAFADEYYAQLKEVFANKGLVPTYGVARVRALLECLLPTGDLLLLRARDRDGRCIATGIFPARHGVMYYWGGASHRARLAEHPNEPLHWHAMRYWKQRGMTCYDMGGGGDYKAKYGGVLKERAWIRSSRTPWIALLRDLAYRMYSATQRLRGLEFRKRRSRTRQRMSQPVGLLTKRDGSQDVDGFMRNATKCSR